MLNQGYYWSRIWMGYENESMAHVPFHCIQNQDFDGPFEIFMGQLGKNDGPKKP